MDEYHQAMIKKRGTLKARITTFRKFLSTTIECNPDQAQALDDEVQEQLKQRVSKIRETLKEFEEIQVAIEEFSEESEINYEDRETFEKNYYEALAIASKLLRRGVVQLQHRDQIEVERQEGSQAETPGTSQTRAQTIPIPTVFSQSIANNPIGVRLPVIELPKFRGELSKWLKFRDTYKSLIHDNPKKTSKYNQRAKVSLFASVVRRRSVRND